MPVVEERAYNDSCGLVPINPLHELLRPVCAGDFLLPTQESTQAMQRWIAADIVLIDLRMLLEEYRWQLKAAGC